MKYSHLAYLSCFQDPLKPSDFIHRPIRIALIAFSAFLLAFTLAMNGLSAGGGGGKEGKGKVRGSWRDVAGKGKRRKGK